MLLSLHDFQAISGLIGCVSAMLLFSMTALFRHIGVGSHFSEPVMGKSVRYDTVVDFVV